jgi:4-amino-4-deoxy-L-arabinose transferase-like glycosyltransferase
MPFRLGNGRLPGAVHAFAALAFVLRIAARLYSGAEGFWVNGYTFFFAMAENIAAGNGIGFDGDPTAFRVPLYPIFLAALTQGHKAFWLVLIAQSLIGAATVFCAALLALDMFGRRAAVFAAAIVALYPYYIVHDTALQETSLFTLLTLLAILALRRAARTRSLTVSAASGLVLGLDVLTRSTIAPFAAIAPLWLLTSQAGFKWPQQSRTRSSEGSLRLAVICALSLLATLSPWLWRNYQLTGVPTLATEAGLQVWNGNNAALFRYYPEESSDISKAEAFDNLSREDQAALDRLSYNEAARDNWFLHRGLAYMRAYPRLTFTNGLRKIAAGFGWLPSPRRGFWPNCVHAASYGPVMLLGLWGMWRHRDHWRDDLLIYLLFLTFALVSAVFFAHTSHRTYLDVYWIVFASGVFAKKFGGEPTSRHASG